MVQNSECIVMPGSYYGVHMVVTTAVIGEDLCSFSILPKLI
jgi:hypothetical protein